MASRTVCLSNIRQLQLGWLAYAEEHKGHFCEPWLCMSYLDATAPNPTHADGSSGFEYYRAGGWLSTAAHGWGPIDFPNSRMWQYVHDVNVYYCPNDTRPVKGATDRVTPGLTGSLTSYGMSEMDGRHLHLSRYSYRRKLS